MENRHALILLLVSLVALAGLAPTAQAYDNVVFHSAINTAATVGFIPTVQQSDPTLANAWVDFSKLLTGNAWDIIDGKDQPESFKYSQKISVFRVKPLGLWIVGGGFSGDEPEAPMAVRHFYDPVHMPLYLTDQMGLAGENDPKMNAIDWVLSPNENLYSFYNGKANFAKALASDDPGKYGYYGSAWRAVGETMHVMTDLCNPAHVRNDGHVSSDPLESVAGMYNVTRYALSPPASLDYSSLGAGGLSDVMFTVARWTNNNFFSDDTIPYPGKNGELVQNNGEQVYSLPVASGEPDAEMYFTTNYNGEKIKAYKMTLSSYCGFFKSTSYDVEGKALEAQLQRVIPTAIRASEAVLDAFLPRFVVYIDSATLKDGAGSPQCTVTARIFHVKTTEWPKDLAIRNGAHVLVKNPGTGKHVDKLITLSGSGTLNQFTADIPDVQPGDQVYVYYDFGGYQVFSDPVTITSQPAVTARPTVAPTPKPAPTYTEVADLITFTNDFTSQYVGYMAHRGVMYTTKYAFEGTSSGEADVTGTITWDTAGVCGPPVTYDWGITTGRDAKYKSMIDLQAMIPTSASPGTYTWRVTVRDSLGHSCTKAYTFTVKA